MRSAIAGLASESGVGVGPYGILRHNPWCTWPVFARSLETPALLHAVRNLLDTESPVLFQDVLVWKPPRTSQRIEWHQDYAYWPLDRPRGLTLWVALDDADSENGCLHYLPGTHREGERAATDFVVGPEVRSGPRDGAGLPPPDVAEREHLAVAAPLRSGEALVHDPLTWHMSPANGSARPRRAWSMTWLHPEVRWDPEHAPHPYNWFLRPAPGDVVAGEGIWRPTWGPG